MFESGQVGVAIRVFRPEDAEDLSRLIVENLQQILIRDYSTAAIELLVSHFASGQLIEESEEQLTLVYVLDGNLVGTASLMQDRIRTVFVDVTMHGHGIGRCLMDAIEAEARRRGLQHVHLMAGLSAAGFYEKLGYAIVEHIDREVDGIPLPIIHMKKPLARR